MLARHLTDLKACIRQLLLRLRQRHACNIRHSLQLRALTDGQDNKAALLTFFAGLRGLLHNSTGLKLIRIAVFFLQLYLKLLFLQQLLCFYYRHIGNIRHCNFRQIAVEDKVRYQRNCYYSSSNHYYQFGIIQLFLNHWFFIPCFSGRHCFLLFLNFFRLLCYSRSYLLRRQLTAHRLHNYRSTVITVIDNIAVRLHRAQLLMIVLAAEREELHLQVQQIVSHLSGVSISVLTTLCQRLVHNLLHALGNIFHIVLQLRHRLFYMHHSNRNRRCADVGNLTRKHFEEHYTQRIDIAAGSNLTAAGLLRRNIMHRTHHRFGINHRLVRDHFGNAEISDFRIHIFVN